MPRKRKEKTTADITLAEPDWSAPTDETLLRWADERDLFREGGGKPVRTREDAGSDNDEEESPLSPTQERILEAVLWTVSLAMLHFTLDVLVQHQYAVAIEWDAIATRTAQAFLVLMILFYALHPHPANPRLLPALPLRYQPPLRQVIFFGTSVAAGCYLIHISNRHGYLAVMKQAPTLGCLWIWAVIELNLSLAVLSVASAAIFLWQGGYDIK